MSTRRSKKCSRKPPSPQPYPWLMLTHGKSSRVSSFYSIQEKRHYVTKIPDVSNKSLRTSCQGWVVVTDFKTNEILLVHLSSLERIKLPHLVDSSNYIHGSCILTTPPNASNSMVGLFANDRPSAMIWHLGQEKWIEQEYGPDRLESLIVCEGKIYGQAVDLPWFDVYEFVGENLVTRRLVTLPRGLDHGVPCSCDYLVRSGGDIFVVQSNPMGEATKRIRYIHVYKFNKTNSKWIRVESIGDRSFFINTKSPSSSIPSHTPFLAPPQTPISKGTVSITLRVNKIGACTPTTWNQITFTPRILPKCSQQSITSSFRHDSLVSS
ncbi:OLC1v1014598C1 [Oldenlandia corymbosa var. corymbosa]|uniref:OLC1v1014598C1 n=1 Tax=Oldenlandia corymbosa var. corymbosa TaxID=529605 RepID=A0AAV1E4P2_OLDCO|nr:OLC1v1014598C1 [Oldenlandia corymbosa var. corymbosa]